MIVTSADLSALTVAFTNFFAIPASDLLGGGPLLGSVYYAYDPVNDNYWALATFAPMSTDSPRIMEDFDSYYGDGTMDFRKLGTGPWQAITWTETS